MVSTNPVNSIEIVSISCTWFQLFGNRVQRLFMASSRLYTIELKLLAL